MTDESHPDFTGKVVTVQIAAGMVSIALEGARYERQVGKLYLVGRQVADPKQPNWADGALHYIAPEQITFFTVFDSLESYLARASEPVDEQPPRRGWFGRRQ
jgi:hypothetical protein